MGWFDEQIKERRQYDDDDAFSEAFANMASAVMGKRFEAAFTSDRAVTKDAIDEILKYYHVKSREVPDSIKDVNEQLEFLMRPYGIMRRTVKLEDGWYRDAVGAMLGTLSESGRVVALIPSGLSGYSFFDYETGKSRRITRKNQHLFDDEAIAFYKPFPLKKLSIASLSAYIVQTLSVSDFVLIALATLAVSLVGLLSPMLSRLLFDRVLPSGNTRILLALAAFTVCVSVSTLLLSAVKSMLTARIETKLNLSVEAATMMRVMSLPADFFKQYSAGELSSRAAQVGPLCRMLVSTVLSTGLTSLFSLIYISQIFAYAPTLVAPALAILLVTVVFSVVSSLAQMKISTEHHGDTEDQAGGRGEARLREMGQPLRAERKNDVRSADVPEAQFRHQPCHQPHGNAHHVLYVSKSRPVCGGLLCLQHGLRHGLRRVSVARRDRAERGADQAHSHDGPAVF